MITQSDQEEKALLSAMLCYHSCIPRVFDIVKTTDFYSETHRRIVGAIYSNYQAGKPVELTALAEVLSSEDILTATELLDIATTGQTAEYYAKKVKQASNKRQIQILATELQRFPDRADELCQKIVELSANSEPQSGAKPFDLSRLKTSAEIVAGDYSVEWVWDKMFPEKAIILLYASGGSGKSTVISQAGDAVSTGRPFLGLTTKQRPVVMIDYENPMGPLKVRLVAMDTSGNVYYWTNTDEPPQLDKPEWETLKSLVVTLGNPLLIFDTLQSATYSLDITSNKDYSPIMMRLKQLRELGATIVLLHHTPKNDPTNYVGASVIYNQVDHVMAMYAVHKAGSDKDAVSDDETAHIYRFGSLNKTRFSHHKIYVKFDKETSLFTRATAPGNDELEILHYIISKIAYEQQTATFKAIMESIEVDVDGYAALLDNRSEKNIRKLLKRGEGRLWITRKGMHNVKYYDPTKNSLVDHAAENNQQSLDGAEFGSFSDTTCQTAKPHKQGDHILHTIGEEPGRFLAAVGDL